MAGIYHGHLLEFPKIRVDCFTSPPSGGRPSWLLPSPDDPAKLVHAPVAQLYLLTHVHSDHLLGLSDAFTGRIVCSHDTKRMLLRLEAERDRAALAGGAKEVVKYKYEGLRARVLDKGTKYERVVDHLEPLPFGLPTEFDLGHDPQGRRVTVTITLLDANHCPGSTMFLITSPDRAVLHTGDVRSDKVFMQTLRRNPIVSEFIGGCGRRLDRIYLDTSAMVGTGDMPDKEEAIQDLLSQMSLCPPDTIFFLNVWCFGWEDIVKEVARHFKTQVHVDRYKRSIYTAIDDPYLAQCTTLESDADTRFHACERRDKCAACRVFNADGARVYNLDKRIVNVNMVEIKGAQWALERDVFVDALTRAALGEGLWPYNILCPVARHAPLPELQALVRLFCPRSLSPNTLVPTLKGIEYFLFPTYFPECDTTRERDAYFTRQYGAEHLAQLCAMQAAGVDFRPAHAGSERDEIMLDPDMFQAVLAGGGVGSSRQANVVDHLRRAGGMSVRSVSELGAGLKGLQDKMDRHADPHNPDRPRRLGDDYDTDDSFPRKRQRVPSPSESAESSVQRETIAAKREAYAARIAAPTPDTRPKPRFTVNKEHLQALAKVCEDEP